MIPVICAAVCFVLIDTDPMSGDRMMIKTESAHIFSVDEFLAIVNQSGWFEPASLPPVLLRMIAEYFILSPQSWMRPPSGWADHMITFVQSAPNSAMCTAVQLFDDRVRWQRVWGTQSLVSGQAAPYFAVEITTTTTSQYRASWDRIAVGVSSDPYSIDSAVMEWGADKHSHVVYCSLAAQTDQMFAAHAAKQLNDCSLITQTGPIDFRTTRKVVIGVVWQPRMSSLAFYIDDKPLLQIKDVDTGTSPVWQMSVPFDMYVGLGGPLYPIVCSQASDLTFKLLPFWTPPLKW